LFEKVVGLEIEKVYAGLRGFLLKRNCKIISEDPPIFISVKQGSIWGVSPRSAKKIASYRLFPLDSGTRIVSSSSLASDWKNLSIIGSVLSVIVTLLCLWIAADLDAYLTTQKPSNWSWLAGAYGSTGFQRALILANLTKVLAVFLAITLALEILVAVYVSVRINAFAEESLNTLV
jgi:hypothetical protein